MQLTIPKLGMVLLATAALVALATGGAAAQELPDDDNATATPEASEVVEQLGDLRIHDYSYDGHEMTIVATWEGRGTTEVTLTEMIELDSGGATQISFKRVRLIPDETVEITVAVDERSSGTAAVLLTTPESIQNNNALVLQDGSPGDSDPVPFNSAILLVLGAAAGGGSGTFWLTRRYYERDEDNWSERIA